MAGCADFTRTGPALCCFYYHCPFFNFPLCYASCDTKWLMLVNNKGLLKSS